MRNSYGLPYYLQDIQYSLRTIRGARALGALFKHQTVLSLVHKGGKVPQKEKEGWAKAEFAPVVITRKNGKELTIGGIRQRDGKTNTRISIVVADPKKRKKCRELAATTVPNEELKTWLQQVAPFEYDSEPWRRDLTKQIKPEDPVSKLLAPLAKALWHRKSTQGHMVP